MSALENMTKSTIEPAVITGRPRVHVAPYVHQEPINGLQIRIKMMTKGWENYTGDFGSHNFTNGVSDEALGQVAVDRVATQIRCIDVATGLQVGPGQRLIDNKPTHAQVAAPLDAPTIDVGVADTLAIIESRKVELDSQPFYSSHQLEDVVDDRGIQGLRDIAKVYGVKARSIPDLMSAILRAQDVARARRAGATR